MDGKSQQQSLTLVPLSIYFKDGRAKVELALARGRRQYDKRHAIATRDASREAAREARAAARGRPAMSPDSRRRVPRTAVRWLSWSGSPSRGGPPRG